MTTTTDAESVVRLRLTTGKEIDLTLDEMAELRAILGTVNPQYVPYPVYPQYGPYPVYPEPAPWWQQGPTCGKARQP